jgi:hypothetical protein
MSQCGAPSHQTAGTQQQLLENGYPEGKHGMATIFTSDTPKKQSKERNA